MLRVVAYTAKSYEGATTLSLRGDGEDVVLVCPPHSDSVIEKQPELLEGFDLVVFNLHGWDHLPVWLDGNGQSALHATTLRKLNFFQSGIFAINCFLGDEHQPMFKALRNTGAEYLVAGAGVNYGGTISPVGADVLLKYFIKGLNVGKTPERALWKAKLLASLFAPKWNRMQRVALQDALKFKLWRL